MTCVQGKVKVTVKWQIDVLTLFHGIVVQFRIFRLKLTTIRHCRVRYVMMFYESTSGSYMQQRIKLLFPTMLLLKLGNIDLPGHRIGPETDDALILFQPEIQVAFHEGGP